MYGPALDPELSLTEQGHGPGQDHPFRLFHHAALQRFRSVAVPDHDGLLSDYFAPVRDLVDVMDRCAGDFYSCGEDLLVHVQAVASFSAERRYKRGMDVDDAFR